MTAVLRLPELTGGSDDSEDEPAFIADLFAGRIRGKAWGGRAVKGVARYAEIIGSCRPA